MWAVLGLNLDKVLLPPKPLASTVNIYADGDEAGQKAMANAGERFSFQQRDVWDCSAPDGCDYNDVLGKGEGKLRLAHISQISRVGAS